MQKRTGLIGIALVGAALATACDDTGATTPFGDSATGGPASESDTADTADAASDTADSADTLDSDSDSAGSTSSASSASATLTDSGGDTSTGGTSDSDSDTSPTGGSTSAGTTGGEGTGSESTGPAPDCIEDQDCPAGSICESNECVPGCTGMQPCEDGFECCSGTCVDLNVDLDHCGVCDNSCDIPEKQAISCNGKSCVVGECEDGFFDCDGAPGCESEVECTCVPDDTQPCYPGPAGTEGVGICTGGTQTCNQFGTGWGACVDFVLPEPQEICGNGLDDDCSGGPPDVVADEDGDGWTYCDNDCCENEFECGSPELVNPGAFEFVGNGVDDDCDPLTSDVVEPGPCSNAAIFGNVTADDMAEAMDLCQTTTLAEPLPTRRWGLISAEFLTADGAVPSGAHLADIMDSATAVMTNYGTGGVAPTTNGTMAGMSSGWMRDQNDPGYVNPNGGTNFGHDHNPPPSYLLANGGALPSSASCNGDCPSGSGANDSVRLRLQIRVPTNALSFSYDFRFFSSEYWTWACTIYNDFYLALLDSAAPGIPADGNISFDSNNNPVSVNNGFFEHCTAQGCYTCPEGTGALNGTGMQLNNTGGGTVWLTTSSPIVPGEIMTLDLMIFDVSDNILDSLVLLDGFQWSIDPSDVGTEPQ